MFKNGIKEEEIWKYEYENEGGGILISPSKIFVLFLYK